MLQKDIVAKSTIPSHLNGGNEENHYTRVMTVGILSRIQRRYLLNTCDKIYSLSQLAVLYG